MMCMLVAVAEHNSFIKILFYFVFFLALRYSLVSGNDRMTFLLEPDTGVLSLSNKRRQGMKLSYLLNVSVSDGVFTNTAQVRQLPAGYNLVLSTDLLFCNLCCVYVLQAD